MADPGTQPYSILSIIFAAMKALTSFMRIVRSRGACSLKPKYAKRRWGSCGCSAPKD